MEKKKNNYDEFGVKISKGRIYEGDKITIYYNGLLKSSGAEMIYLHIGYGEAWNPSEYIPMNDNDGELTAEIEVQYAGDLNVCFKDTANNWDNNSSVNYTYKVYKKRTK